MSQIFKIQLAISSSLNDPPALVYNKDRSISKHVPEAEVIDLFNTNEYKIFARGEYVDGKFINLKRIPDRNW
jgi:hypothetical protein